MATRGTVFMQKVAVVHFALWVKLNVILPSLDWIRWHLHTYATEIQVMTSIMQKHCKIHWRCDIKLGMFVEWILSSSVDFPCWLYVAVYCEIVSPLAARQWLQPCMHTMQWQFIRWFSHKTCLLWWVNNFRMFLSGKQIPSVPRPTGKRGRTFSWLIWLNFRLCLK